MKTKTLMGLLTGLWLIGCAPDLPAPSEDVNALHQRFHGKYKPISSVASERVDVNFDGKLSDDLLQEYPYLDEHDLRIDIYGPSKHRPANSFTFYQLWPEQYVSTGFSQQWNGELIDYDPRYSVNFNQQGSTRAFTFSPDVKQIYVEPYADENLNAFRWLRPESVTVEANGYLRVINKRRLFTTAGVREITITTLYERYTMTT